MVEGGSSEDFAKVKSLFYGDRATFDLLLEKLTSALIAYFHMQIGAGADAIQIFDSWGGAVAGPDYQDASLRWIREIIAAMPRDFPIILYGKGTGQHLMDQASSPEPAFSASTPQTTSPPCAAACRRPSRFRATWIP